MRSGHRHTEGHRKINGGKAQGGDSHLQATRRSLEPGFVLIALQRSHHSQHFDLTLPASGIETAQSCCSSCRRSVALRQGGPSKLNAGASETQVTTNCKC